MFQEGATRLATVDASAIQKKTAKRIVFWISCVDSQADEQVRDRFIMFNVGSGDARRQEIINFMKAQDEGEQPPRDHDFETMVCQALTYDLKQQLFNVKIPFASRIKLQGDPRAYGMLSDMIKASAALHYMKREMDANGWLIATDEDFENARSLYVEIGGHDPDKYTTAELQVLDAIVEKGEATQSDIQEYTGLSAGRVSDILNGRNRQGHGLLYKCGELIVEDGNRPIKYKFRSGLNPKYTVSVELT
jgi:hypothetical protein